MKIDFKKLLGVIIVEGKEFSIGLAIILSFFFVWLLYVNLFNAQIMEFKGTKLFPKYEGGDNYSIDLVFEKGNCICIDRTSRYSDEIVCSREEMEANALLISKAPEMLEMLKSFVNDFDNGLIEDFQTPRDRFEQLIKQATEL